ncbi:hypothetical protein JN531_004885 [Flagellatimonas centrodinii]|uniref:DUF6713 family protein n=1 Tax=Flagellatimonas centrodinii TaxID=2806210 RepID=UPI001FF00B6A|nr:DUF6713 family protein [Flagellatimonas centrodinii]ULQ47623.1 hypothetical protein JN531_004885 [Flagellatimonas centrodinii]
MKTLLFLLGFAFLATHEIDAALNAEWRLLYILRGLPEPVATVGFIWGHVPLFAGLLWGLFLAPAPWPGRVRAVLAAFLVVHAGLHWRLSDHALYAFSGWDSNGLIWGAGLCGLGYLLCLLRDQRGSSGRPPRAGLRP